MMSEKSSQNSENNVVKKQIISIANELFHSKCYEKVSMRDIAAAAGVTTGALYHYFENKQAILIEAFRNEFNEKDILNKCKRAKDPEKSLMYLLCEEMPNMVLEDGIDITRTRVFHIISFESKQIMDECVSILIAKGIMLGVFADEVSAEDMSDLLCSIYRSTIYQYCVSKEPIDLKKILTTRISLAMKIVKKPD